MTEPLVLFALRDKRAEIERHIEALTARLSDARSDLLHVAAVMALYDPTAKSDKLAKSYSGITSAFKRSELFDRCVVALKPSSDFLTTRELATAVIAAEAWDAEDRALRITIPHRITTHLGGMERRGLVQKAGERAGVTLWRLPE